MIAMSCGTARCRGGELSALATHDAFRRARRCSRGWRGPVSTADVVDRYYDPETGQFLSIDPDLSTTLEAYLYAGDDPVNDIDPAGLGRLESEGLCTSNNSSTCLKQIERRQGSSSGLFSWIRYAVKDAVSIVKRGAGEVAAVAKDIDHYAKHNFVDAVQLVVAGACVIAPGVGCAIAVAVSTAAALVYEAATHQFTSANVAEIVVMGLLSLGEAGTTTLMERIAAESDISPLKEKLVVKGLNSIMAAGPAAQAAGDCVGRRC